jgi:acyl carrier protein phosphodiesterase
VNFLAHAYLSFENPEILVGNMISDFVKGKAQYDYPKKIHEGIVLHRRIDAFTDSHKAVAEAKKVFQPHYRLYSGAMIDIVFDHFLANDKDQFPNNSLLPFTSRVYQTLESFSAHLPARFIAMFPYMKTQNWLYHYKDREGIARSLRGMVRRSAYITDSETAVSLFNQDHKILQECYDAFFPDVKKFTKDQSEGLVS